MRRLSYLWSFLQVIQRAPGFQLGWAVGDAAAFESSTFLQVTPHPYTVSGLNILIGSPS